MPRAPCIIFTEVLTSFPGQGFARYYAWDMPKMKLAKPPILCYYHAMPPLNSPVGRGRHRDDMRSSLVPGMRLLALRSKYSWKPW